MKTNKIHVMKSKLFSALLLVMIFLFTSCEKEQNSNTSDSSGPIMSGRPDPYIPAPVGDPCQPRVVPFFAGQTTNVGNITIKSDSINVYVTFNTTGGWVIGQTQLYVGSLAGLPKNKMGNPMIGNFPYKTTHNPMVTSYAYTIPRSSLNTIAPCIVVATHAEVHLLGPNGEIINSQTAWGAGQQITKKGSWASYIDACLCNKGEKGFD